MHNPINREPYSSFKGVYEPSEALVYMYGATQSKRPAGLPGKVVHNSTPKGFPGANRMVRVGPDLDPTSNRFVHPERIHHAEMIFSLIFSLK